MYLIRRTKRDDLTNLYKFARMVHFINLPADRDLLAEKIARSRMSFRSAADGSAPQIGQGDQSAVGESPLFMFSIEDTATKNCLGTSSIIAHMGSVDHPNFSFKLSERHHYSKDLKEGHTHLIAELERDTTGCTEIGGLILDVSSRGHRGRLGKQLSFIRFHYIGLHREVFADEVLAEMMAPINDDGTNAFWENLGRRFINLSYAEADAFCQHSREFLDKLLPQGPMYMSVLPPEARAIIGEVGRDTRPARALLERLGFAFRGHIDPFDGGPHLRAQTDDIPLVKDTSRVTIAGLCDPSNADKFGFVSSEDEGGEFRALYSMYREAGAGAIEVPAPVAEALGLAKDDLAGLTPIDLKAQIELGIATHMAGVPKEGTA